jgi:hypothetical protein
MTNIFFCVELPRAAVQVRGFLQVPPSYFVSEVRFWFWSAPHSLRMADAGSAD